MTHIQKKSVSHLTFAHVCICTLMLYYARICIRVLLYAWIDSQQHTHCFVLDIRACMYMHQYITIVCMCRYMHPYAILCSHMHQSTRIWMNKFEAAYTLLRTWYSNMYVYASICHYENRSFVHVSLYASLCYIMLAYASESTHMHQYMCRRKHNASHLIFAHVCMCINMSSYDAYVAMCILMLYYARICVREHADASINA